MEAWDLKPEEIKERLDKMVWSFSRVNSINSCLYAFYNHYIAENEDEDNAYAQFGKFCHEILEKFLKGEIDMFSVSDYYIKNYDNRLTYDFPPNKYVDLGEKMYLQGKEYFDNFTFNFKKYEVLGVEQELEFKVGKYPFHGYADVILKDKETGEIILCDHKTTSFKYLKDGSVSKKDSQHFLEFRRQIYLYCIAVIEKYSRVDKLRWNMIRDHKIIEIPFNESEFKEAQEWAVNSIQNLEKEVLWLPDTSNSYYCHVLCGQRNNCLYHQ